MMTQDRLRFRRAVFLNGKFHSYQQYVVGDLFFEGDDTTYTYGSWEQCTGLKDKKNQLLYEGDIIKIIATGYFKHHEKISNRQARNILKDDFRYSLGVERIIGFNNKPDSEGMYTCEFTYISKIDVVTMDRFPCCWLKNEEFGYEGEGLINPRDCIKIGNIHENPDLLKSGEVQG